MQGDAAEQAESTGGPPAAGARAGASGPDRKPRRGPLARVAHHSSLVLEKRVAGMGATGVLLRLWAWQLWRRTVRRTVIIRCAEGSLLVSPSWSRATASIAGTGLTERDDALFAIDLLRAGDLFVDVGANVGFYTMLAARRGARVEAFEPTPEACAVVERGIALNAIGSLATVHRAACGSEAGTARFSTGLDISNHLLSGEEPGIEVRVVTLDSELADSAPALAMLKVDAEGHDLDVLRGALETIARLLPVILVEIWTGGAGPLALVEPYGYRPFAYDPAARTLDEIRPGERQGGNMLLIAEAQLQAVRERVRAAQRPPLSAPAIKWLV
ncbi:MAG TPA: FkbM family methyltransferase [Solirubrobacteraceae bacterium]|nr:FkbM family methyltransferase [Solirubrobacteraceae bacterium]